MLSVAAKFIAKKLAKAASKETAEKLEKFQKLIFLGGFVAAFGNIAGMILIPVILLTVPLQWAYDVAAFFGEIGSSFVATLSGSSSDDAPGTVGGTCPLPNGYLLCGVLGGTHPTCQHGDTTTYWEKTYSPEEWCTWSLPVLDPLCTHNSIPGNTCNAGVSCSHYGRSSDFSSNINGVPASVPVTMPQVADLPPDQEWQRTPIVSDGGCGHNVAYQAVGEPVIVFLEHLSDVAPDNIRSGEQVSSGLYTGGGCGDIHLHVEIQVNGVFINPDDLCDNTGGSPGNFNINITGYYIEIPESEAANIHATDGGSSSSYFTEQTCTFASRLGLDYAINANLFTSEKAPLRYAPIALAGDNYHITNFRPDDNGVIQEWNYYSWGTFAIDSSNTPLTDLYFGEPKNNNYRLAVSGIQYDSAGGGSRNRTAIGQAGGNIYFVVLKEATVAETEEFMNSLGVTEGFTLDSGGSTSLCAGGNLLFGGTLSVPTSIGVDSNAASCFYVEGGNITPCN